MYKVPISVLEDCSKTLSNLKNIIEDSCEFGVIDVSKKVLKYTNKAEDLIKLIELNYGIK
jgi:hypothetical protein